MCLASRWIIILHASGHIFVGVIQGHLHTIFSHDFPPFLRLIVDFCFNYTIKLEENQMYCDPEIPCLIGFSAFRNRHYNIYKEEKVETSRFEHHSPKGTQNQAP